MPLGHDSHLSTAEGGLSCHSPWARRLCDQAWVHVQGLYPEDDDDGHVSMYASTRPILAPTRAEARPVFTREVSAERGVRLPGGSRLQGVTRVSIYLSEDPAYDVKPEPEKVLSCPLCLTPAAPWLLSDFLLLCGDISEALPKGWNCLCHGQSALTRRQAGSAFVTDIQH